MPYYFDILAITEHVRMMKVFGIWMDDQCPVFNAAACAEIRAVSLEKHIHWLLAQRLGREMNGASSPNPSK